MASTAPPPLARVLVVEDERQTRQLLTRILDEAGYEVSGVDNASEARRLLAVEEYDVLLSDIKMPGESGLDLVNSALKEYPRMATLLISGVDDPEVARVALAQGAYGYMTKPIRRSEIVIGVMNALSRRELEGHARLARLELEDLVRERTRDLETVVTELEVANVEVRGAHGETIERLARAVETREPGAGRHLEKMSAYAAVLADELGLDGEPLRLACMLHDVGKVGIPDAILLKPGPLTPDERTLMKRHTAVGVALLKNSSSDILTLAACIAATHHEKFDGTGYPLGLGGTFIPIEGRIAAVADVFDALTSDRVYRSAWPVDDALHELNAQRGKHFDPDVLDAFNRRFDQMMSICGDKASGCAAGHATAGAGSE